MQSDVNVGVAVAEDLAFDRERVADDLSARAKSLRLRQQSARPSMARAA